MTGQWDRPIELKAAADGTFAAPDFPGAQSPDWAAKVVAISL